MNLTEEFHMAVQDCEPVSGLTHDFYRYPARFSPLFVRAVVSTFTGPGDVVVDPFMGGGTTLVEATALGRRAIGTDINNLAVFVSRVKTTVFLREDLRQVWKWANEFGDSLNLRNPSTRGTKWEQLGYFRSIDGISTWPLRKTIELILARVEESRTRRQKHFARCVLLKTAQWALDCRSHLPSAMEFRERFIVYLNEMTEGAKEYANSVLASNHRSRQSLPRAICLHRSAIGIENDERVRQSSPPALILTSPPYPGVHVLYHRWQVKGRKETPAPFWIANCIDGNGESFYTFGNRKDQELTTYYDRLRAAFCSLARIADQRTLLVQLVAFSDPSWQLPKYLDVMQEAGFMEVDFPLFAGSTDGRLWRQVPNRKWYANQKGTIATSKELVLFHRLA